MSICIRKATWADVECLFEGCGGGDQAMRNIFGWARRYGVDDWMGFRDLTLESWSAPELAAVMEEMTKVEPRVTVDMVAGVNNATLPPRLDGLPAVFVKLGDRYGIIDGKHRVNRWKLGGGPWAVLVIHA